MVAPAKVISGVLFSCLYTRYWLFTCTVFVLSDERCWAPIKASFSQKMSSKYSKEEVLSTLSGCARTLTREYVISSLQSGGWTLAVSQQQILIFWNSNLLHFCFIGVRWDFCRLPEESRQQRVPWAQAPVLSLIINCGLQKWKVEKVCLPWHDNWTRISFSAHCVIEMWLLLSLAIAI